MRFLIGSFIILINAFAFGQNEVKINSNPVNKHSDKHNSEHTDSISKNGNKIHKIAQLEIPKTNSNDKVISHTGFSFLYNETHEQSDWVAYELTESETNKIYERTNDFIPDPLVISGTANNADYQGSGFDRGHLAPASDMGWSEVTMKESFYFSNMSPQVPSFNRGIWKKLEELVRVWAIENQSVYVVTGPVLSSIKNTIGKNKVSVPNFFYKVVLDYNSPEVKGIGFIMPNVASGEPLEHFAVSIDSVEVVSGIDFFPLLQDDQEKEIEKNLCTSCWSWKSSKPSTTKKSAGITESAQCAAHLNSGERCKKMTINTSGFCQLHEQDQVEKNVKTEQEKNIHSNTVQCSALTKNGKRCKRMTASMSGKCFQHDGN